MKHIELKGARVPALGFGTFEMSGGNCTERVAQALELGYRHIDTAQAYNNEAEVGKGIEQSGVARGDFFLTTKVWMDKVSYDQTKRSTEESLSKLKTDYVDLLLIHWPSDEAPLEDTLRALAELRQEGKTRFVGVSNFNVALLKKTAEEIGADVLCNQVEYHPYLSQQPVLDYLRAHDMFLTAYSPIARGKTAKDDTLKAIGQQYGKSPVQVALRWLIQQDNVAAIPKASSEDHCRSNFEIFDFELSDGEMGKISGLARPDGRLINPSWAPQWDT